MLATCAAEVNHQVLEAAGKVFLYRVVDNAVDMGEEVLHGLFLVEEGDDGLIASGELLVLVVATGVVDGAAVEDEAASVSTGVLGDALTIGETGDAHGELSVLLIGNEEG